MGLVLQQMLAQLLTVDSQQVNRSQLDLLETDYSMVNLFQRCSQVYSDRVEELPFRDPTPASELAHFHPQSADSEHYLVQQ